MWKHRLLRRLPAVAVAAALVAAGCGEEEPASAPEAAAPAASTPADGALSGDAYREAVGRIRGAVDSARSQYHNTPAGDREQFIRRALEVARASETAAGELEGLRPPETVTEVNRSMAEDLRALATELKEEAGGTPPSLKRIGDIIRKHEKSGGDLYDQVLTAP